MPLACAPLLRFALHALLALAVLLQASLAVAMHASPSPGDGAGNGANGAALMEAAATVPPCHTMAAAHAMATDPVPADCCNDSALGESCRWACAQVFGLPLPLVLATPHAQASGPEAAPILPAPRWTAQSPLRPPIG